MVSDSFVSRWSKRKIEGSEEEKPIVEDQLEIIKPDSEETLLPTQAESEITKIDETDNNKQPGSIASLLASQAAKETKKAALRQLFLSGEFSEVDRLNDYDHDYSSVKPLASEVAQKLREWVNHSSEQELESQDKSPTNDGLIAQRDQAENRAESIDDPAEDDALSETKNTT